MPIELSRTGGGIVICTVAGKLVRSDYERFSSRFDGMLQQHGKLRVLFEMKDFHGWEPSALWDEIKFDIKPVSYTHLPAIGQPAGSDLERRVGPEEGGKDDAELRRVDVELSLIHI